MSIDTAKLHTHNMGFMPFPSRRSTVFSAKGMVATSQPLAAQAGLEILNQGGNAADAAIATAAAMNVCEPTATGIGGDAFCLYYDAATKEVHAVNGSGRAPAALTLQYLRERGIGDKIPLTDINSVTCPGTAAAWCTTIDKFGSKELKEVLGPAIRMAKEGVPVHELNAEAWKIQEGHVKGASENWREMMMPDGNAPLPGQIMTHPELAATFESLATHGYDGFYKGRIARAIVDLVASKGGLMTLDDLSSTTADVVEPIKYDFLSSDRDPGISLWECPPNGQGLTALVALGIVEAVKDVHGVDVLELELNGVEYLHVLIEALRLAFADTHYYVTDPEFEHVPVAQLLSKPYLRARAELINLSKATPVEHGNPTSSSDTIYLATSDIHGNACSFIQSNYAGFGTGAIPKGCGFTLQNRGSNFTLREGHPNNIEGGKRPYHTIIPAMLTRGGELVAAYGVMGGFMQPQGHLQVLLNVLRGLSPQHSLDAPRFCISAGLPDPTKKEKEGSAGRVDSEIWFEEGIDADVVQALRDMGHQCEVARGFARKIAGRGQMVAAIRDPSGRNVWAGGSDMRGDGCAVGQI
ncbi:hypothetical protein CspHIS471_0410790 [Cutaneotrichosporon sp. HIS471]|nr:hypothetical protein CspHIS471_0410790 [Cutaneotrichosporon sp. HIS471]